MFGQLVPIVFADAKERITRKLHLQVPAVSQLCDDGPSFDARAIGGGERLGRYLRQHLLHLLL